MNFGGVTKSGTCHQLENSLTKWFSENKDETEYSMNQINVFTNSEYLIVAIGSKTFREPLLRGDNKIVVKRMLDVVIAHVSIAAKLDLLGL